MNTLRKHIRANIQRFFSAVKIENFNGRKLIFLLKTLIVGIC